MSRHRSLSTLVRDLSRLAAPVAAARIGIMGMGVTDTIVVGHLAPSELPALALGWAPTSMLLVGGIGLLMGVQVLVARATGEGRLSDAGGVWRRGLVLALVAGIFGAVALTTMVEPLFALFGIAPELARPSAEVARILGLSLGFHFAYICSAYFAEAVQQPMPGTVVIWLANAVNLGLNLMLVPVYGAEGSAWSTVGGRVFMFAALALWVLTSMAGRSHSVRQRAGSAPSYGALLAIGSAAGVSQLAEAGAFSMLTVIAGRIGAEAVAAYQLLLNTLAFVFMVALGVAAATAVLVAEAWGRRDHHETGRIGWVGVGLNTAVMAVFVLAILVTRSALAGALTSDVGLAAIVAAFLPVTVLVLIPDGAQAVLASALRARGDNWLPTASHILSYVMVMPPLAWWLGEVMGRGVSGLMESIIVASFLSAGVLAARLWQVTR